MHLKILWHLKVANLFFVHRIVSWMNRIWTRRALKFYRDAAGEETEASFSLLEKLRLLENFSFDFSYGYKLKFSGTNKMFHK